MNRFAYPLIALLLVLPNAGCDEDALAIKGFTDGNVVTDAGTGIDGQANFDGDVGVGDSKVDTVDACVPTEEVCDGKDNDCDGVVDNVSAANLANDAKNCGKCGQVCQYLNAFGKCVSGKCELDTCAPGFYDNNKDPKDGCEYSCIKSNGGVETCPSSQPNCACDGVDNDCDGQIDEDFNKQTDINNCGQCGTRCLYNNAGALCDQGTCKMDKCKDGFVDLNQDTKDGCEYKCPVWPPTAETCDGIDNDCDGNIDEGLPGAGVACDSGLQGECKAGTTRCENGKIQCIANKASQPETCDGKDNDCDGTVDNGFDLQTNPQNCGQCGKVCTFTNASASCVAGQCTLASCTPGFRDLNNNPADGCEHTCAVFPTSVEKCNGKDDDCDNQVDEDFNLQTDINNCGTCGKRCSFVNAQATCQAGQCVMGTCDVNYIDLNKNPSDGCEYFCVPTAGGTEICDNVDNNCDGKIDETFDLQTDVNNCGSCGRKCAFSNAGATCVNGQCQMAQCTAGFRDLNNNPTDGCEYKCPVFPTTTETCNGQDDNCDGRIDEGLPGAGVSCDTGQQGECKAGTTRCQNGTLECVANLSPQPETCDGKDNDCDGAIDNGFNLQSNPQHCGQCGRVCSFANATPLCIAGQCQIGTCAPGFRDLNNNPADGCEHTCQVFPTSTEKCNGQDDDCDNQIDEDFNLQTDINNCGQCGRVCSFANAQASCVNGQCVMGQCNATFYDRNNNPADGCEYFCAPTNGGVEICDNVDNNCDGRVDETFNLQTDVNNCGQCGNQCAFNNAGATCVNGQCQMAQCTTGYRDLNNNPLDGCEYRCPVFPTTAETCNGQDDNCDGRTDEGLSGGAPCNTSGQGECRAGTTRCRNGTLECIANLTPQPETCDGKDNDCDGTVDNGFDLQNNPQHCGQCGRVCSFANATPLCISGQCTLGTCNPGFRDLNNNPADGCEHTCAVFPTSTEQCNGRDDDCDNQIDEDFNLQTDINNCGQCGRVCSFANAQASCVNGQCVMGQCNATYYDRNNNPADGCEYFCVPTNGGTEICDNVDNNCDGQVDETFNLQTDVNNCGTCGRTCSFSNASATCVNGQCQLGTCNPGYRNLDNIAANGCEYQCPVNPPAATDNNCDGVDNNCNGQVDEGYSSTACGNGTGQCQQGQTACVNGTEQCQNAVGPTTEICDNLDNDCDGNIDNGFNKQSDPRNCGTNCVQCALPNAIANCTNGVCGIAACQAGWVDLDNNPANGCEYQCTPTGQEICDGIDNDCDGLVDGADSDMAPLSGNPCIQVGSCSGATATCQGSNGWVCNYGANVRLKPCTTDAQCTNVRCNTTLGVCPGEVAGEEDKCDGIDNDCDGLADEVFPNKGQTCYEQDKQGVCQGSGVYVCNTAQDATECNITNPGIAASNEKCNGKDDDCDGLVDEETDDAAGLGVVDAMIRIQKTYNGQSYDFYIYTYEASKPDASATSTGGNQSRACSTVNKMPWSTVTYTQAAAACAAAGKRLCTETEWFLACSGAPTSDTTCNTTPNDGCYYPYGDTYQAQTCNGKGNDADPNTAGNQDAAVPTGSMAQCVSPDGVIDMSGNLMEWTSTQASSSPVAYRIRGGSFNNIAPGLRCDLTFVAAEPTYNFGDLGFRCCSDTAP